MLDFQNFGFVDFDYWISFGFLDFCCGNVGSYHFLDFGFCGLLEFYVFIFNCFCCYLDLAMLDFNDQVPFGLLKF